MNAEIPCLLSKSALKKASAVLYLQQDKASIFGKEITLDITSSGHYAIPINKIVNSKKIEKEKSEENLLEEQVMISVLDQDEATKEKQLVHIHKQFCHPSINTMKQMLKESKIMDDSVNEILEKIYQKCEICLKFKRSKVRPSVGLPLSSDFNDTVAMDLKIWPKKNIIILYLIDTFTRYTQAFIIPNKKAETIIDCIMKGWIYNMFGAPRRFLADNGGEFANDKYRDMCENLNIEVLNTGAESPWSNGLVERNHACVDLMLEKMIEDNPTMRIDLALASAVHAKNCQPMVFGWSPIHLVTGKPPIIHNSLTENPPALCRTSSSKAFAERANAAISARDAFNEIEKSSRLRRALLKKIVIQTEVYQNGDKVFYKSGNSNKWKGTARVVAVDGKVIFIKHGRSYLAVSPTRLVKANNLYKHYGHEVDKLGPQIIASENPDHTELLG